MQEFNKNELNRYLGSPTYSLAWASIADKLEAGGNAEAVLVDSLDDANPAQLFQLELGDLSDTSAPLLRERAAEVTDLLEKNAAGTAVQKREPSERILRALRAIQRANPSLAVDTPQFWAVAEKAAQRKLSGTIASIAEAQQELYAGIGVIGEGDVALAMRDAGLDATHLQAVSKELDGTLRVLPDLPAGLVTTINRTFDNGLAAVFYPQLFENGATPEVHLFPAAVEGASGEVTLADLDNAIAYFTRNPELYQREKTLASQLRSQLSSDQDAKDWFTSYYMGEFRSNLGATLTRPANRLRELHVSEDDVEQLLITRGANAAARQETWADPTVSEERAQQLDTQTFGHLERSLDQGRVAQAKYELDQILASGEKPRSTIGADIVEMIQAQARRLDRDTATLDQAVRARNPIVARQELDSISDYCVDSRKVGELAVRVNEMERDPMFVDQVINHHFQPIQDEGQQKALGFLPQRFSNVWLTPLALGVPAAVLDSLVSQSNFFGSLIAIFLISLVAVFLEEFVESDGCIGWIALLGPAAVALASSGIFGAVAVGASQFASRTIFENRERQKAAEAFNKLVERARVELQANGTGSQVAGFYVGDERVVPPVPSSRSIAEQGAFVVDGNGLVVEKVAPGMLFRMHQSGQFVGKNSWMNEKVG